MKKVIRLALLCFCVSILAGNVSGGVEDFRTSVVVKDPGSALPREWYRDSVFMLIYVRAYRDSNKDGVGDIKGLTEKLDYLHDLGIKGIWLMPIMQSLDHDHGYSVSDYRNVEAQYGTLTDFKLLLAEAHKRGIGIIIDYPLNHSSLDHPAFLMSQENDALYRSWYIWSKREPRGWRVFSRVPWYLNRGAWYYAAFGPRMPDFNFNEQSVVDFHKNNVSFWLNQGVDGIRFDAVGVLVENGPSAWINQAESVALMAEFQKHVHRYQNRYMVCEAVSAPSIFGASNACGSAFAYGLQRYIRESVNSGRVLDSLLAYLKEISLESMGTFLTLHDHGAGARLFDEFNGDLAKCKVAAATLLGLPGIPFVYYGEEVGMSHATSAPYLGAAQRAPMSFNTEELRAGFTDGKATFRGLATNYLTHNVAVESKDTNSLFHHWRELIHLRNRSVALVRGGYEQVKSDSSSVFAFLRTYGNDNMLVILNFSRDRLQTKLSVDSLPNSNWRSVYPAIHALLTAEGAVLDVDLKAHESLFLELVLPSH